MSDVQLSVSCFSGNQKCENKPYTLKETLHLKKIDIIICTIKKSFTSHKNKYTACQSFRLAILC